MLRRNFQLIFTYCLLITPLYHCQSKSDTVKQSKTYSKDWTVLVDGMYYAEFDGPKVSILGDSKVSVLKFNKMKFDYMMLSATQYDSLPRTASQWADSFDLNVVINAGMYNLAKQLESKGYLKNYDHYNNPLVNSSYNAAIAFNPIDTVKNVCFNILDMKCTPWDHINTNYNSCAQGMRMLDCDGNPLSWDKKKQSCSMLIAAKDLKGNIYFIFTRSPYTHNEMIQFMLHFPEKLTNAIYMEGGPETSLYINIGGVTIEKVGSYVSNTYPTDKNNTFWPLPNVIGLKIKK
jgi:hypothetical protein